MKKLILTVLAVLMLMTAAAAYEISNSKESYPGNPIYTEGINNDPVAQAQMLYALGLFKGRAEGDLALSENMTREEAAVMLTRFLGDEAKALERNISHPFPDVAEWANPYVGWLYHHGYTKGIGGGLYGGKDNVTYWQFGKFLSRAIHDVRFETEEDNLLTAVENEHHGRHPIPRAQAVSLSARALGEYYTRDTTYGYAATAKWLWHNGVFTAEQFWDAAWEVYPATVDTFSGQQAVLTCLHVEVARSEATGLTWAGNAGEQRMYHYAIRQEQDGYLTFCTLDYRTMEVLHTQTITEAPLCELELLFSTENRDYFDVGSRPVMSREQGGIYVWDGTILSLAVSKEDLWRGSGATAVSSVLTKANAIWEPEDGWQEGILPVIGTDTLYTLTDSGVQTAPLPSGTDIVTWDGNNTVVVQRKDAQETVIYCISLVTGHIIDEYHVTQDVENEVWYRELLVGNTDQLRYYGILFGTAGLYEYKNDRLTQYLDRPVLDADSIWQEGKWHTLILSHDLGERHYSPVTHAGDEIWSIHPDTGELTLQFRALPEYGVDVDDISGDGQGNIFFTDIGDEGHMNLNYTTYRLVDTAEGRKLEAVSYSPGRVEMMVGTALENVWREQKRLYELGIGVQPPGQKRMEVLEPALKAEIIVENGRLFRRSSSGETTCTLEGVILVEGSVEGPCDRLHVISTADGVQTLSVLDYLTLEVIDSVPVERTDFTYTAGAGETDWLKTSDGKLWVLENGTLTAAPEGLEVLAVMDYTAVFQQVTAQQTVLWALDALTGQRTAEYRIAPDAAGLRTVTVVDGAYFYGEAGLYAMHSGKFQQLTQMPVLDLGRCRSVYGVELTLLTHPEGVRMVNSLGQPTGDRIYSSTEGPTGLGMELRYINDPAYKMEITALPDEIMDSPQFTCTVSHGTYTYLLAGTAEAPNIWTVGYEAKDPASMTKTWSEYLWDEIDRLHALGASDPGPSAEDRAGILAENAKEGNP